MNQAQFTLDHTLEEVFANPLCEHLSQAWILVYSHRKIILEKMNRRSPETGRLTLNEVGSVLIFSADDEFKLWVSRGQVGCRLWSACRREDEHEYEEKMLLWGTRVENGTSLVEDGRGCRINFPGSISAFKLPLHLVVKNYYNFDENGLIRFYDARLTAIRDNDNSEVI